MTKEEFVNGTLNETTRAAFRYVDHIEFEELGSMERVVIVCENGYEYKVNVTCNSHGATAMAVFEECLKH